MRAESGYCPGLNGEDLGYSEDSKLPAEFRVPPQLLRRRGNLLAVEVIRWSDGSYLEDQDMWRLSGLTRDIFLLARPPQHIRDVTVLPKFSSIRRVVVPCMETGMWAAVQQATRRVVRLMGF